MILQQVMKLTCVYKKLESFTQISYRQHTCLNICTRRKKVTLKTCIHVTPLLYRVYTILFHAVFFNSLPLLLYVQSAKIRVKRQTQTQLYLCMYICKCIFIYERMYLRSLCEGVWSKWDNQCDLREKKNKRKQKIRMGNMKHKNLF